MEAVILRHQTALLRYAAAVLNNPDLAQQVVQDVFIKLFSKWDELDGEEARLRVWLFRVTHNEAVDLIRAEERRKAREARYCEAFVAEHGETAGASVPDERTKEVLRCVRALSESRQRVVLLRLQQGMGYEEISAVTGFTVATCRNLLSQAIAQLAELVEKAGGAYA